MTKINHIGLALIAGFILLGSCSKKEESIDLSGKYHYVADVLQYCKGSCDETNSWENSPVWVKGYISNLGNESVMNTYYEESRFYLNDIRNGMFMYINVVSDKDDIFNKIRKGTKTDRFYIRGVAKPIVALEENSCIKGVVIELSSDENLQINAE